MMTCMEAERLCDRYLDKTITREESAAFFAHISVCRRCADNWLSLRHTVDLVEALPNQSPDPCLLSNIMLVLPRGQAKRKSRSIKLSAWQAAAAVLIVAAAVSICFLAVPPQMAATAVENNSGRTVVQPQPGRLFVIPPGATVTGDLNVQGDVYLQGRVQGSVSATGRIVRDEARGLWQRITDACGRFWRALTGGARFSD